MNTMYNSYDKIRKQEELINNWTIGRRTTFNRSERGRSDTSNLGARLKLLNAQLSSFNGDSGFNSLAFSADRTGVIRCSRGSLGRLNVPDNGVAPRDVRALEKSYRNTRA
ncbi:hypothetical protein [Infirmifilum sp.]|uniref:hypothetical protein n=1 Tax=Infirmifilum sp. TaxID=2856575 RepID=UPI003D0FFEA3